MRRSELLRTPRRAAVLVRGSRAVLVRGSRALCSLPTAVPQPPPSEDRAAVRVHVKQTTEMLAATVLTPLNARLLGPLERSPFAEGIPLPFVLLLGNHSSGKSSFINFVLGRPVQATGVAPTDDGFTVIKPGAQDVDRDGASFVGDPAMGFAPLRSFGPPFMSHLKLKVREGLQIEDIMLIDSPGMIDSPAKLPGAAPSASSTEPIEPDALRAAGTTAPGSQER